MIDATTAFAPVSLTRIVANDSVRMVQWWAANRCPTPIDGDEIARTRDALYHEWHQAMREGKFYPIPVAEGRLFA